MVTGPESTGKTTLAKELCAIYDGQYIAEYAREYIEGLDHPYTFEDVETIAGVQVEQYLATRISSQSLFVFDTWLIITKIWFKWVYHEVPEWIEEQIRSCPVDLFLLCKPDLPWAPDLVRENGGENRVRLYEEYKEELDRYGFPYAEIGGAGKDRLYAAVSALKEFYEKH